jgi:hypothetical protein
MVSYVCIAFMQVPCPFPPHKCHDTVQAAADVKREPDAPAAVKTEKLFPVQPTEYECFKVSLGSSLVSE